MSKARRDRLIALAAVAVAAGAATTVILAYLLGAGALVTYPWDWSPDEGLHLDWARRLARDPPSLHAHSFVPFPSVYGPMLPLLLAPVIGAPGGALFGARLLSLGFVLGASVAVYRLVRRRGDPLLALAAVALALTPFDATFWHVLVRPDGPMLALLLLAAVALMPDALERGADRLSSRRLWPGTLLLLVAVLTKSTAALHAAPMVLGWWLVDRRGALRLTVLLGAAGFAALGVVQWLTAGGYLWAHSLWRYAASRSWLPRLVASDFLALAWPLVAIWLVTLALTRDRRAVLRDGSVLLLAGGLLPLALTTMSGASWNYLLPLVPALAVATGRAWATGTPVFGLPRARAGAAFVATAALALALARPFPLPTAEDERTARVFYRYLREHTAASGGPILAVRPDYAYFHVGQPVEVEGPSFTHLARGGAPGTELVEQRLAEARYTLVVWTWPLPETGRFRASLERWYAPAGGCKLGFYFGAVTATLLPRRDLYQPMLPQAGTRCGSAPPAPPMAADARTESP